MIDSHQHFWRYEADEYAWIDGSMAALRRDFLPENLIEVMRPEGVDATIAVQARQTEAETDWLLQLAARHPFVRGVVGWVDLQADDANARVDRVAQQPGLVGLRHVVQAEPDGFLQRPAFRRGGSGGGSRRCNATTSSMTS